MSKGKGIGNRERDSAPADAHPAEQASGTELERLNHSVFELSQELRMSQAADEALLRKVRETQEEQLRLLRPHRGPGPYAQAPAHTFEEEAAQRRDFSRLMPYSPIIGRLNPVSPRFHLRATEENEVEARVVFPVTFAGPPDTVHGGFIAAVFDELLSLANIAAKVAGWTGTLTVRYRRPTPILKEVLLRSRCDRVEGRKAFSSGTIHYQGELTAEAEGIFIAPPEGRSVQ